MKQAQNLTDRYRPAVDVGSVRTGTRSGDLVGLSLRLVAAAADPGLSESLHSLGHAWLSTRDRIATIQNDPQLSELGKAERISAVLLGEKATLAQVRENRRKVAILKNKAEATRNHGIAERVAIVEQRRKADPDAVNMMVQTLLNIDPLIANQRVKEAAAELGEPKERYKYLLAAARRIADIGAESAKFPGVPVFTADTLAEVDNTLVATSTVAAQYEEETRTAELHEGIAKTVETALGMMAEGSGLESQFRQALASVPADGGPGPTK